MDIESIIKGHAAEDGTIPADAVAKLAKEINQTVGREFVEKSRYKAKLEEIDALKTEKQSAEDNATTAEKWKTKYEAIKGDLEALKADYSAKETHAAKESAYRDILKAAGVSEKRIKAVLKVSDVDSIELDADGKVKDADKLTDGIKSEWADFIESTSVKGAQVQNPPQNDNSDDAIAKNIAEVRKAMGLPEKPAV